MDEELVGGLRAYHRVGVTGGMGFVGRHLVASLVRAGIPVRVLDLAAPPRNGFAENAEYCQVDLRDPVRTRAAVEGIDLLFHLAGNASGTISVQRPRLDFEANAQATFTLAEALLAGGIGRMVYMSSAMVYGRPVQAPMSEDHPLRPFVPYGATKLSGELIVNTLHQSLGLPVVTGRSFTIYGPGEDPRTAGGEVSQFLRWHLNRKPVRMAGHPDRKTRDFVHVTDVVRGLLTLAVRGEAGQVVNIGTGREVSLRALAQVIGEVTGRRVNLLADTEIGDDTYRHVASIDRLRALGYQPRMDLRTGVAELARHLGDCPDLPTADVAFRGDQLRRTQPMEVATC